MESIAIYLIGTNHSGGTSLCQRNSIAELNYIMFNGTIFMIIMSWTTTTHNCMITCDPPPTGKAKSILFNFDYSKYTIYFIIWIYD